MNYHIVVVLIIIIIVNAVAYSMNVFFFFVSIPNTKASRVFSPFLLVFIFYTLTRFLPRTLWFFPIVVLTKSQCLLVCNAATQLSSCRFSTVSIRTKQTKQTKKNYFFFSHPIFLFYSILFCFFFHAFSHVSLFLIKLHVLYYILSRLDSVPFLFFYFFTFTHISPF
jgi:hypothetical protein